LTTELSKQRKKQSIKKRQRGGKKEMTEKKIRGVSLSWTPSGVILSVYGKVEGAKNVGNGRKREIPQNKSDR